MSNIQTGAERMPHDLSHLGFLAGQIGRLITISTTPVIAGDSFEMDAVGALRLSPLRRGLAIDSTVDIFTFYVPHRHVYGEQWIKFMKDGVNATPLLTVNTTGYIDHALSLHDALPILAHASAGSGRRVRGVLDAMRIAELDQAAGVALALRAVAGDRKSTRLNSSHSSISYAVFCLKKKRKMLLMPLLSRLLTLLIILTI